MNYHKKLKEWKSPLTEKEKDRQGSSQNLIYNCKHIKAMTKPKTSWSGGTWGFGWGGVWVGVAGSRPCCINK